MRWFHKVRLYPKKRQRERLKFGLDVTRQLYNALIEQYRWLWTTRRTSLSAKQRYAEVTALRKDEPRIAAVYRELEDAVLHRFELGLQAFFRRVKCAEAPGFPRYKPFFRWHQLEFPHGDRAIKFLGNQGYLRAPGIGWMRLRKGRGIPTFGRVFIVEKNGHWYATFECEREVEPLESTGRTVGIDAGVHVLAATSEGHLIPNARPSARHRRVVTRLQRELDAATHKDAAGRCLNRNDPQRRKAVLRLARAKEREANLRLDHAHKSAKKIVALGDRLALEKLNIRSMTRSAKGTVEHPGRNVRAKSALNRVILDAGWGLLRKLILEKAEGAARAIIWVDAKFSSQRCRRCLHLCAESRRKRRFRCVACGWSCHADVAAALELRRRAQLRAHEPLSRARTPLESQNAA